MNRRKIGKRTKRIERQGKNLASYLKEYTIVTPLFNTDRGFRFVSFNQIGKGKYVTLMFFKPGIFGRKKLVRFATCLIDGNAYSLYNIKEV